MMFAIASDEQRLIHQRMAQSQVPQTPIEFDVMGLLRIFDHDQQITIVPRAAPLGIAAYLQSATPFLGRGFQLSLLAGDSITQHVLEKRLLPLHAGYEQFLADIALLVQLYVDLMGCPRIGIRLEVLTGAMCPKFHVDRTGIRMLCTYQGPGTEWLDDRYADRSQLGTHSTAHAHHHDKLVLSSEGLQQVPVYAIALLKGSLWQGNAHRGAIHRSPTVPPQDGRVLLAIDALWS